MGMSTFQGPVRSLAGFIQQGPANVVTVAADTTLSVAAHGGKIIRVTNASAVITLPAVNATADAATAGPGADPDNLNNQGVTFTILFDVVSTANRIAAAGSDRYIGSIAVSGTTTASFGAGTTNANISLNGTTSGGAAVGSMVRITSLTTNKWMVDGRFVGSGTVVTPFGA
jgi:hypothetical protein